MAKQDGLSDLVRVLDNLYTRVFEQSPPQQNRLLSDVIVVREEAPPQTEELDEFGGIVATDIPVTLRAWAPLVKVDVHYEYYAPVLSTTSGSAIIRFKPNFGSNGTQLGLNYLMSWVREE